MRYYDGVSKKKARQAIMMQPLNIVTRWQQFMNLIGGYIPLCESDEGA